VVDQPVDDVGVNPSLLEGLWRPERLTPPYYYHLHKEEKRGHSCGILPAEGNKGSNVLARLTS